MNARSFVPQEGVAATIVMSKAAQGDIEVAEHPAAQARVYTAVLKGSASFQPFDRPLRALVHLHANEMPWKVRLSVLVTGRIPLSYLENFK